jgi:hypothetical protein
VELRIAIPEEEVKAPVLDAGLEVTTRLDEDLIAAGKVPMFRDASPGSAIVWKPEPPGAEHFDHAARVLARGNGDCDDLAPWHAASLRQSGEDPGARAIVYQSGPNRWHAVVRRSDGSIDDPSLEAGMRPAGPVSGVSGDDYDDDQGDDGDDQGDDDGGGYDASDDGGGYDDQGADDGGPSAPAPAPPAPSPPGAPPAPPKVAPAPPRGGMGRRPMPPKGRGVPPHLSIAPPVLPRMFASRRPAVAVRRTVHGFQARADLPYLESEYSLSALAHAPVAPQSIVGAIAHVMGYARAAGCVHGKHKRHLAALAGLLSGQSEGKMARLCGKAAVASVLPLAEQVMGLQSVVGDNAPGAPSAHVLPPQQVHNAMASAVASPRLPADARKLAAMIAKHAAGVRPPPSSLKGSVVRFFDTIAGPVRPHSPDDHARLLIADQVAKHLTRPGAPLAGVRPDAPTRSATVGDLFGDIGNALGDAGKAVAGVVKQVGPVVAQVAAVLPPPYGPAIALAAQGATALANAAVPDAHAPGPSSAPMVSPSAAAAAAVTPGAAAAAHPSMMSPGSAPVPRYIHFVPGAGGHVLVSFG